MGFLLLRGQPVFRRQVFGIGQNGGQRGADVMGQRAKKLLFFPGQGLLLLPQLPLCGRHVVNGLRQLGQFIFPLQGQDNIGLAQSQRVDPLYDGADIRHAVAQQHQKQQAEAGSRERAAESPDPAVHLQPIKFRQHHIVAEAIDIHDGCAGPGKDQKQHHRTECADTDEAEDLISQPALVGYFSLSQCNIPFPMRF